MALVSGRPPRPRPGAVTPRREAPRSNHSRKLICHARGYRSRRKNAPPTKTHRTAGSRSHERTHEEPEGSQAPVLRPLLPSNAAAPKRHQSGPMTVVLSRAPSFPFSLGGIAGLRLCSPPGSTRPAAILHPHSTRRLLAPGPTAAPSVSLFLAPVSDLQVPNETPVQAIASQ